MELEERYVVLKKTDIGQHLNEAEKLTLAQLCKTIDTGREGAGKESIACLIIESDWPEFGTTLRLLAQRVDIEEADAACKRGSHIARYKR